MSENTNEKDIILENLNYIGLNLNDIPSFLKQYKDVDYKPTKAYEQTDFKIYKYINLRDIQILLTPTNRLDSIIEKYSKAVPLKEYLDNQNEKNIINYVSFFKMLEKVNKKQVQKVEEDQTELRKSIPFKVKYDTNYLWEIYYSEYTGKYFMMLTTEDLDYSAFFYLLKRQIECYKNDTEEYIFVPINYLDYTKRYLKKSEIQDLEKFIWLFTKDWAKVYEVFDKENNLTIHIVGITNVYDRIKSYYKIQLKSKEESVKFYTVIKALFILQTELPHHYNFEAQIDEKGELIFEFNNKVLNYNNLSKFIKEEYKKYSKELQKKFDTKEELDIKVEKLKEDEIEKNKEYLFKEKQVATYLKCRTTLFGKIKYFFKNKNGKYIKAKKKINQIKKIKEINEMEKSVSNAIIQEKELYTIEDLIKICIEIDRIDIRIKDDNLDIKALENKIQIINNKIKNATLFVNTIEEHKKSIFEFWKFANKDLAIGLNAAEEKDISKEKTKKIKKTFDYEEDLEDLGIQTDEIQRKTLSNEETNALFILTTNVINDINKIRNNKDITLKELEDIKKNMKKDKNEFEVTEFDIFGNIKNDKTKISVLSNKKHRESEKDKYKVLDLSDSTNLEEYSNKLKEKIEIIDKCINKLKAVADINIYFCSNSKLDVNEIKMFYINPTDAINSNPNMEKINLYKIKIKEGMNIIYNTNIIYYNNFNNTLPVGMNINNTVTFDMNKYKIDLKKQKVFRINNNNKYNFKEEIICVYEYEAK